MKQQLAAALRTFPVMLCERVHRALHYTFGPSPRARAAAAQALSGRAYYELYDDRYSLLDREGVADRSFIGVASARRDVYEAWEQLRRAQLLPNPGPETRLVDLGCGEGDNAVHFAELGYRVTGVDVSPAAIAHATQLAEARRSTATFHVDDVLRLGGTPDATYDVAIDVGCLHMLVREADRHAYLATARRVLRPGGAFFLFERVAPSDVVIADEDEHILRSVTLIEARRTTDGAVIRTRGCGFRSASLRQYRADLTAAGFDVRHAEHNGGGYAVVVAHVPRADGT